MESDAADGASGSITDAEGQAALNSTILEYYKNFGRKRDLEQYFALNTAPGDIKDVSSLFWRRMKSQDSSDSGEKSRDSSVEVCRISIKCSTMDTEQPGSSQESQDDNDKPKSDSGSPPIIVEEVTCPSGTSRDSDNESVKSDDNQSRKSMDVILDTSMNRQSPTSSITSQRKLEWDSLADVGYANESDKRTSASSLSTLERLALKQQYSNNDTNQENLMGLPTAHSTPVDENEPKQKNRRGSKTTKIYKKDVDFVEVNVPSDSNPSQCINVNLTKHISLNVDKSGVSVENIKKDVSIPPNKRSIETVMTPHASCDKEIQTSLIKTRDKSSSSDIPKTVQLYGQTVPVLINLNTYKRRHRRKKFVAAKKKLRSRKQQDDDKENLPMLKKSNEQVSEAESFEYMPGHIYNQNQMNKQPPDRKSSQAAESNLTIGNKSSLESSGVATTDSSKGSKCSFTKDLDKGIKLLKTTLNKRYEDTELKEALIKKVVQKLLQTPYRDDDSSTDFLSGLSFSSKKIGLREGNTTTSTSDANNTTSEKSKATRPKKSILRVDKFNSSAVASTSQSAPNLVVASNSEKPVGSSLNKSTYPYTESASDSSKEKTSSDTAFAKTSSEELYQKYLDALRREEAYKKHLREKDNFLKQKLVCSEVPLNVPAIVRLDNKSKIRLKELMKDLTRNNYDDGSGDASKLEGGFTSDINIRPAIRTQKSHSVFTLSSSGNSDQNRKPNMKKNEIKDGPKPGHSKESSHYCCCPHHYANKIGVVDSSVQVNMKNNEMSTCPKKPNVDSPAIQCGKCKTSQPITLVPDEVSGEIKYLCMCNAHVSLVKNVPDNLLIYKCSRLMNQGVQSQEFPSAAVAETNDSALRSKINTSNKPQSFIKENSPSTITKVRIHEAVRMTQTDISIDPKISEPSLTDIKVINNCDCVKLVCEQYREVSKTSFQSKSSASDQKEFRMGASECSEEPSSTSTGLQSTEQTNDGKMSLHPLESRSVYSETIYGEGQFGEDVTIQGDNMTLKFTMEPNPTTEIPGNCLQCGLTVIECQKPPKSVRSISTLFPKQENENLRLCACTKMEPTYLEEPVPSEPKPAPYPDLTPEKATLSRCTSPCPCPEGTQCDDAICVDDCVKQVSRSTSPIFQPIVEKKPPIPPLEVAPFQALRMGSPRKSPRERLPKKMPCSCPTTAKCGGFCGKNAACRKEDTIKETLCGKEDTIKDTPCGCPPSAKCGGFCGKNAACRKKDTIKETLSGKEDSIKKTPCGCPPSAKCGGFCGENAACRKKDGNQLTCMCPSGSCCGNDCKTCSHSKETKRAGSCHVSPRSPKRSPRPHLDANIKSQTYPQKYESKQGKSNRSESLMETNMMYKVVPETSKKALRSEIVVSESTSSQYEEKLPKFSTSEGERKLTSSSTDLTTKQESQDLIMNAIQEITSRYSKKDIAKDQKKKCFKEIVSFLNYFLDTDDSTDIEAMKGVQNLAVESTTSDSETAKNSEVSSETAGTVDEECGNTKSEHFAEHGKSLPTSSYDDCVNSNPKGNDECENTKHNPHVERKNTKTKTRRKEPQNVEPAPEKEEIINEKKVLIDKGIQISCKKPKPAQCCTESSDLPISSELPCTSSDSVTYHVLNRIRRECERYQQKRCKCCNPKKMECTTSVNCEKCKPHYHCACRTYKCKYRQRNYCERLKKKCVAYNLIIQTSESMVSETTGCENTCRPLKSIIMKVPSKKPANADIPCGESRCCSPRCESRKHRSRSLPNDSMSSTDDNVKAKIYCVKDYLEKNRPDFIEQSTKRQNRLKMISETRASNRAMQKRLVSMQVQLEPTLRALSSDDLRTLAREAGLSLNREPPKLLSEREMKQHSSRIYRRLPEVLRKKEELKKENIKKTNMLMANIFKKSLQKKTLRGSVNLSNYSNVIRF